MRLEVLHVPGCPNLAPMLARLRELTELPIMTREISTDVAAAAAGMNGSPTLLVNGRDPFAPPGGAEHGVSCRLYRDELGRPVPVPSAAQMRDALTAAADPSPSIAAAVTVEASSPVPLTRAGSRPCCEPARPGGVLSAWRTRAVPLEPVEKAVHQAILRGFAATGRSPVPTILDPVTEGSGRGTAEVLAALHELDAIRLAPDGQIVLAYPFSATPTRHRVRINREGHGDGVEVFAMCAIDALGMSAMIGRDTGIDSADVTSGHPITVTTTDGHTVWEPGGAVVFIGADPAGGPSADCCCDYVNFFTDTTAAEAWAAAHPQVPGQILTQAEAEYVAARIFGSLLAGPEPVQPRVAVGS